jgi:hypothetical protein
MNGDNQRKPFVNIWCKIWKTPRFRRKWKIKWNTRNINSNNKYYKTKKSSIEKWKRKRYAVRPRPDEDYNLMITQENPTLLMIEL